MVVGGESEGVGGGGRWELCNWVCSTGVLGIIGLETNGC